MESSSKILGVFPACYDRATKPEESETTMKRLGALSLAIAAAALLAAPARGGDARRARLDRGPGILAAAFLLPEGNVYLNLPDDLAAGDAVSGTLVAEPAGRGPAEIAANRERLLRCAVRMADSRAPVAAGILRAKLPSDSREVSSELLDENGRAAASIRVPLADARAISRPASLRLPTRVLAGNRARIAGSFGGDLSATSVRVGSQPARIVAESPRQCIFESPASPAGRTTIEVREGRAACRGPLRNIVLKITSPKTDLLRGEHTTMTVELDGLEGLEAPLTLTLANRTPAVVSMEMGEEQTLPVEPGEVAGGAWSATRGLTGIQRGDFDIEADLPWTEEEGRCVTEEGPGGGGENVDNPEKEAHHCQGGRLVLIIGDFKNTTIAAALEWAKGLEAGHVHRLAYDTHGAGNDPTMAAPYVPGSGGWSRFEKAPGKPGDLKDLLATWHDCCYFDEVLVMFHGHQVGGWNSLIRYLPLILDNRPVRKLVLWSCESTDKFAPGIGGDQAAKNYRQICGLVRPKDCPCDCKAGVCRARNADGGTRSSAGPLECPTAQESVTVLASGSVERGGKRFSAKLGLDTANAANPFTSPDGSLRRITIAPDGAITSDIAATPQAVGSVFAGKGIHADSNLTGSSTVPVDRVTDSSGKIKVQNPTVFPPEGYGPRPAKDFRPKSDPSGEGCFPGAADTSH